MLVVALAVETPAEEAEYSTAMPDEPAGAIELTADTEAAFIDARSIAEVQPLNRATELLGKKVLDPQGEKLGKVDDVVLTDDKRAVEYVALRTKGEKLFAVPLNGLQITSDGKHLVYQGTAEDMAVRKGFPQHAWPDSLDAARATQETISLPEPGMSDIVTEPGTVEMTADAMGSDDAFSSAESIIEGAKALDARRVSVLLGYSIIGTTGERVGTIRDLLIDTESGSISEATIGVGGLLGIGERFASVPWLDVQFDPVERHASIHMSPEELDSVAFERKEYWERLGFAGPEKTEVEIEEKKHEENPETESLPSLY